MNFDFKTIAEFIFAQLMSCDYFDFRKYQLNLH